MPSNVLKRILLLNKHALYVENMNSIQWILDTTVIFRLSENWCSSEIDVVLRFDLRRPENDT